MVSGALEPTPTQTDIYRRLDANLYDLGLLDIVGPDWIHPDGDGFAAGPLSLRAADQLLRRFDELVSELVSCGHVNRFGSPNYIADDPALRPPNQPNESGQASEQLRLPWGLS